MSESPKTIQDLQKEYTSLCSKAGHLSYQIKALGDELALVQDSLKAINLEAAALQAQAPKAPEVEVSDAS